MPTVAEIIGKEGRVERMDMRLDVISSAGIRALRKLWSELRSGWLKERIVDCED